jgi:hypothetical protein
MIKRIVLALALAASLGGAVLACSPAATPSPSIVVVPSVPTASEAAPSDVLPSAAAPSSEPSAS